MMISETCAREPDVFAVHHILILLAVIAVARVPFSEESQLVREFAAPVDDRVELVMAHTLAVRELAPL